MNFEKKIQELKVKNKIRLFIVFEYFNVIVVSVKQ